MENVKEIIEQMIKVEQANVDKAAKSLVKTLQEKPDKTFPISMLVSSVTISDNPTYTMFRIALLVTTLAETVAKLETKIDELQKNL